MKKRNLLLLSLISLTLVGCNDTSNSTKSTASKSEKTSEKQSVTAKKDSAKNSETSSSTKPSSTSKETDDIQSESKSSKDDEDDSLWPDIVKDTMKEYLDNRILPYINLGISPSKIQAPTWSAETSTLTIMGGYRDTELSQIQLNDAKDTYEKALWEVALDTTSMTATNPDKDITVKYYVNGGIIYLDATYKEKFNPTVVSSYPNDLLTDMNNNLGNHALDIPFVYLGTKYPVGEAGEGFYTITGGEWNDEIITLANTAFINANKSISNDDNKWSYSSSNDSGKSSFTASVVLSDDTKFKISINEVNYSETSSKKIAKMIITYTPPFVPTTTGSWSNDITNVFNNNFHGHSIPWFYIGSQAYLNYSSEKVATILSTTGTWNDQIFTLAKDACDKENQTITNVDNKWTYKSSDTGSNIGLTMWTFTRTLEDGCLLKFTVENYSLVESYGNKALIYVYYTSKYQAPANADWSNDTKTKINEHLDNATIPYLYLGTTNETSSWDDSTSTLTITGSDFYETLFTGAKSVFTSALGWTGSIKTVTDTNVFGQEYSWTVYEASKVIDATIGTKLIVTVDSTYHYSNMQAGNCVMKIKYEKPFTVPNNITSWDDNTFSFLKSSLAGHTIPWIYLNSSTVSTSYSKWTKVTSLTGGLWDDGILTHANAQLTSDNWENIQVNNSILTSNKTEDDGCQLSLKLCKDNSGKAKIEITFIEAWSEINTSWSDSLITDMKECLNDNVIPFIQLGSPSLTVSNKNVKNNYITITSNVWSDTATSKAKSVLDNEEGWETIMNVYDKSYQDQLNAFKFTADGSAIYLSLYKTNTGCQLYIAYYKAETISADAKTSWNDKETAFLNDLTDGNASYVPYLYIGDGDYTLDSDNDRILGTGHSPLSILKYYSKLKSLGYTSFGFKFSTSYTKLMAGYKDTSGNEIYLETDFTYDDSGNKITTLTISYKSSFNIPDSENSKWKDNVKSQISDYLGENETIPYIYLGTLNPKTKLASDNSKLEIYSNVWYDEIIDLAYTAFTSSSDSWTVVKDLYDNQVIASRKTSDNKVIKVVVKKHVDDSTNSESAYIEIYCK